MEMTVRMPAYYNVMSEDEMTYITGGADKEESSGTGAFGVVGGIASLAVTGLLVYNWIDQLLGARSWYATHKTGNLGKDLEAGVDQWLNYTTTSVVNCVRSVLATAASFGSPVGWVVSAIAFATV